MESCYLTMSYYVIITFKRSINFKLIEESRREENVMCTFISNIKYSKIS